MKSTIKHTLLQVLFFIALLFQIGPNNTLFAQPKLPFEWLIAPTYVDYYKSKENLNIIYFVKYGQSMKYHLKTEQKEVLDFEIKKAIYEAQKCYFITSNHPKADSLQIRDFELNIIKSIPNGEVLTLFTGLLAVKNRLFKVENPSSSSTYFFNLNSPTTFTIKKIHTDASLRFNNGFITETSSTLKKIRVYTLEGKLLFEEMGTMIQSLETTKGTFLINPDYDAIPVIYNEKGELVYTNEQYQIYYGLGDAIRMQSILKPTQYIDLEGKPYTKQIRSPYLGDSIFKIANCPNDPKKYGLEFKNAAYKTECLYQTIGYNSVSTPHFLTGLVSNKENPPNNSYNHYYALDGSLYFDGSTYTFSRYLKNDYFVVQKEGKCGVVNNKNEVIVPFKYQSKAAAFGMRSCHCQYGNYEGKEYWLLLLNPKEFVLLNEKGEEILRKTMPHKITTLGFKGDYISIDQQRKRGLISTKGKVTVPFEYKAIGTPQKIGKQILAQAVITGGRGSKVWIDIANNETVFNGFKTLKHLDNNLLLIKTTKGWGVAKVK